MPTFQFWLNGKKMEEFSGGDEGSLRRITNDLARKARQMNMELTAENLLEFYKEHEPSKTVRRWPIVSELLYYCPVSSAGHRKTI
eukprot:SAG31_NODE_8004_length_1543_cov_1.536011_2_plen_85_part_00